MTKPNPAKSRVSLKVEKTLKNHILGTYDTMTDFCSVMGITTVTLQRWINGTEYPSCEEVAIMSRALGKSPMTLVQSIQLGAKRRFAKKLVKLHTRIKDQFPETFTRVQHKAPRPPGLTRDESSLHADRMENATNPLGTNGSSAFQPGNKAASHGD